MARTKMWIAGSAAALLVAGTGAGIAAASGHGDDGEGRPITGQELDRASATALKETGGGRVTGSEVGDEEGYYEVEVTPDGIRMRKLELSAQKRQTAASRKARGLTPV